MTLRTDVIVIHSVGLLGGSLGRALKAAGHAGRIIGLSSEVNLAAALSLGCIDEGRPYADLPAVARECDLLFLCSPVGVIIDTIRKLAALRLPAGMVITDVGSTKRRIVEEARAHLPAQVHFIGGHPMAGSETSGAAGANALLFRNAAYALVAASTPPAPVENEFAAFIDKKLGCRHIFLDAATHDRMAAAISHLPHLLAVALLNAAARADARMPGTLSLVGGGFRDMTRIASSPYRMWHDIFATNADAAIDALDDYIKELNDMRGYLQTGRLAEPFAAAARTRTSIAGFGGNAPKLSAQSHSLKGSCSRA